MKLSINLKKVFSSILFYTGITGRRIINYGKAEQYCMLMYHRILPVAENIQAGMYVTPDTFNKQLIYLKDKYTVISLKELMSGSKNELTCSFNKPLCILTFDDGWKDFYDYAFPLLHKYQLPATVFLPTQYIGSDKEFWTDSFTHILSQRKKISLDDNVKPEIFEIIYQLQCLQGTFEEQLENGIELLKNHSRVKIDEILSVLSKIWAVKDMRTKRGFLNWSEIDEMHTSGLISFGSHTVAHEILTTIPENEVQRELVNSKNKLLEKGLMDSSCQTFCYPNGNYTKEIARKVRESGYHIAVTTKSGWNRYDSDMLTLHRIGIHQDMTSIVPLFAARIAGIF